MDVLVVCICVVKQVTVDEYFTEDPEIKGHRRCKEPPSSLWVQIQIGFFLFLKKGD